MKLALILSLAMASPAIAQEMDHSHHGMDHGAPAAPIAPAPAADPHAGHHMPAPAASAADPHAGHQMPVKPPIEAPAPAPPGDRAADRYFPAAEMAAARSALIREHGGMRMSQLMIDMAEIRPGKGADIYAWEGALWTGGDIDRLTLKSEGEGAGRLESAEVQALWSHAVDAYWNLQAGVRQDIRPRPGRSYASVGVEGLAPYWFDVEATVFLSNKGDVSARLEAYYDQRITQRLVLQPRIEANLAASGDRRIGVGSGLVDAELGLRLRYEIIRRVAPYIGVVHERRFGKTGRLATAAGEDRSETRAAIGVRAWF